jgi:glutamyl-tRNA reductase
LVKHTKNEHITLINRTKDKAEKWQIKLNRKDYSELHLELQKSGCCCGSYRQNPTVDKAILNLKKTIVNLRLVNTKNVNKDVEELEGVTLIHMDYLSQL